MYFLRSIQNLNVNLYMTIRVWVDLNTKEGNGGNMGNWSDWSDWSNRGNT